MNNEELLDALKAEHTALTAYLFSLLRAEHQVDYPTHHKKYEALIEAHDRVVDVWKEMLSENG
jgi:hypothetical protein